MSLLNLTNVSLAYGTHVLLDHVELRIEPGERVCLIGRNGVGKSTLLRVLSGDKAVDEGELWRAPGLRVAGLAQELPQGEARTVFEVVAEGLGAIGGLVSEYHACAAQLAPDDAQGLRRLARLQQELEAGDGWRLEQRVESVVSRLNLPADQPLSTLSGGWQRRALLAQALVSEPDLLLLDEPTNHLDIEAIVWLEEFLMGFRGALLFITHDRAFLRRLATRLLELDRGRLTSWPGDYDNYLRRREERLHAEDIEHARFDKKLAQEEVWIRQGIKARRTRNEGRVRALEAMRREHADRRGLTGEARISLDRGAASGRLVIEADHISKAYDGVPVVRDFSLTVLRGDRVGLLGPNGIGKSTLLKLLLGELAPDSGTVRLGTNLQVAYFDQTRAQLDPERSVVDTVSEGSDSVMVNGRAKHVMSYLQDFLFAPERARSPVKALSGGERNRLLLARLFARPANLLVMDEPTNDLDVETLELLEELLSGYDGTLLLVSHDRDFLDHVVTSTLAFEGNGVVREFVGGYQDWLRQSGERSSMAAPGSVAAGAQQSKVPQAKVAPAVEKPRSERRKLGYKEQRELHGLPARIEALEAEQARLQEQLNRPEFYQGDSDEIAAALQRLNDLAGELETAFARWEALEAQSKS